VDVSVTLEVSEVVITNIENRTTTVENNDCREERDDPVIPGEHSEERPNRPSRSGRLS